MNKQRRKELEDLHDDLQNLLEKLETIMEEEEEYKDNLPEIIQCHLLHAGSL